MTIIVTGRKLDQSVAEDAFRDACQYLRQSRFAAFLLNELMTVPQLLHIEVTASPLSRNKDAWRRPKNSEPHSAGRLLWNLSSGYFAGEHGNTRPGLGELERHQARAHGDQLSHISPALVLMHELGKAYQYLIEKAGFQRYLSRDIRAQIHNLNLHAIDNAVALQLWDKAYPENHRRLVLP